MTYNEILAALRKFFGHGNLESINSDFDLLAEKGEMAIVVKKEPHEESTHHENSHHVVNDEHEYEFDDETLKRIYKTIREIKAFKKKTNKLRDIKFAKHDKP
jgi:hypothetical protein